MRVYPARLLFLALPAGAAESETIPRESGKTLVQHRTGPK